ncbi:MAG: alginate O-acetyltransferase complex protein AlgI [Pseudohongiellaceae bacterium]
MDLGPHGNLDLVPGNGVSLTINLGLLGAFKYGDSVLRNVAALWGQPPLDQLSWVLPIGISFFTFQTLSYSLDVYRRKTKPCRDPATFALYVCSFPQRVAGPIERAADLLPQLRSKAAVSSGDFALGFQRILWGLVKKLVVADRLAFFVGDVFAAPGQASGAAVALATVAATAQLYLDFSAYSDIDVGVARMLGVRLSENFRWPFLSSNPAEFCGRWHITLTQWFRDDLGRPLGAVRANQPLRTALRVVFVMGLVGLWHRARWNFVVFGLVAGLGLAITSWRRAVPKASGRWQNPQGLSRLLRVAGTLAYVNLCMLIFVSPDMGRTRVALSNCVEGLWVWELAFAAPRCS